MGNPITVGLGNKWQIESDYRSSMPWGLPFERHYNSDPKVQSAAVGAHWRHHYDRTISVEPLSLWVRVYRPNGKVYIYTPINGNWIPDAGITDQLIRLTDAAGNPAGWTYTILDDAMETYDANGRLLSITNRAGLTQTLAYDASGHLVTVTDPSNHTLTFTYDSANRISTMTDPAGGLYTYSYDANNNLSTVSYPDATPAIATDNPTRIYYYENASFPHALTGITDETGARYATYAYDTQGRAISSEHADGAERISLVYNGNGTTTVTDARNAVRTYRFETILGLVKNTAIEGPACTSCGGAAASATTYDANGNVASRTDFKGNVATYSYDLTRNLETSRTEAKGTPQERTITTDWHPTFRLPVTITEPGKTSEFTYDSLTGNLLTRQETDTATGETSVTRYTYTTAADNTLPNLLKAVDGSRTDAMDITTYGYDPQGNLSRVTNAAGHLTQITAHDAHGRPLSIQDPNGLLTTLTYDPRGRLTSMTAGSEVTRYAYDNVGQLTKKEYRKRSEYDDSRVAVGPDVLSESAR